MDYNRLVGNLETKSSENMDEDRVTGSKTWGLKEETDQRSISIMRSTGLVRRQRVESEAGHEAEQDLMSSLVLDESCWTKSEQHKEEEGAKHELA